MNNPNLLFDARRFTFTVIISVVVVIVFALLMMLWHGSYEKDANGKINYNTRVNEPNSNY